MTRVPSLIALEVPPTLTLPHEGGGNQTEPTSTYTPSPSMGEGRGGGDACVRFDAWGAEP